VSRSRYVLAIFASTLVFSSVAEADRGIRIGPYSDQVGPSQAAVGARIAETSSGPAHRAHGTTSRSRPGRVSPETGSGVTVGGASPLPPVSYPSISPDSPLLQSPAPRGPQTFWYSDGSGHLCIYVPKGSSDCYAPVGGVQRTTSGVNPGAVAAVVASRMDLAAGRIEASPLRTGLTGADSWFWLEPAPQPLRLSVSLGGETVSVSATPEVEWRFGDGASFTGGAGIPYQPGAPPAAAIRHVFQTRCLPGDQGSYRDALATCGTDGYTVAAVVSWRIDYEGSGPVGESGSLPTRTTTSATGYPVSEARVFLVSGGTR
jgi:hypothetical protein